MKKKSDRLIPHLGTLVNASSCVVYTLQHAQCNCIQNEVVNQLN